MSELLNTLYHTDNNPEYFDETDLLKSLPKEALVNANDEVAVDNPDWLVYALAAELARGDYSKDDQYANLAGMAEQRKLNLATTKKIIMSVKVYVGSISHDTPTYK